MSIASSSEVEYWVLFGKDVGYFAQSDYERLTAKTIEVRRMLFGFRRAIRKALADTPVPKAADSSSSASTLST